MKTLVWVDQNDLNRGARPLVVTVSDQDVTRPNETSWRTREVTIKGPSVLRFDPDNTGLARVWIETEAEIVMADPKPAYR